MKTVNQTYLIHAPLHDVWDALVNPTHIVGWGAGPAVMDDQVGTKFSLWGGEVYGTNIEVLKEAKLVQEWYSSEDGKWEKPSIATFTLEKVKRGVKLELVQTDVPEAAAASIAAGWKEFYFGPLKAYLE